ncbi:MATH and LRR domain-containing protein PFE0570w isoform X1 [Neodiprion lecontei]|uniref:MATH and LRR domain-containing protein PFE0570w isoform X1 n=1 Tax=Neodiprion lecontei TaxID=441921 RepID=A0A6J0BCV3_NEOLC|nr:MATH and LRR domain-containing protein PFE0570w isoform X1 [Neodiprion lecontei]XP_046598998.1 MATH and LRR domain-containing protein PFE0570w isoform X1 [Neodiprion lecontei]XP_046598999.1 MATH and LRR domain-containing protein PFE0570w isoform X1 [Neodiprion lecontei]
MASREKRPLAPSKSKQKVNNDCTSPSVEQKSKKGKAQTNTRQQQIAQDILEAVATDSQLPVKINANLPRKKAIKNLRHKSKLQATKSNLIKVKITKKVPIRALRKTNVETIRAVKGRRTKKNLTDVKNLENNTEDPDNDNGITKTGAKGNNNSVKSVNTTVSTFRNSLKSKKIKNPIKSTEVDNSIIEVTGKETDSTNSGAISSRNSPKTGRKIKITCKKLQDLEAEQTEDSTSLESENKYNKVSKVGPVKRSNKEKDNSTKAVEDTASSSKMLRLKRNTSKERDIQNNTRSPSIIDTKSNKAILDNKNLVDLTIDEVISTTVVRSVVEETQGLAKKTKKGRKISERPERLLYESEIKKEPDMEELKIAANESSKESDAETLKSSQILKDMSQNSSDCVKSTLPRTRYNRTLAQRSLRNGKLRGSTEFVTSPELEGNKQYKLESGDQIGSDTCPGDSSGDITESDQFFYESNLDSAQGMMDSTKAEIPKNNDDVENNATGIGNNNNNNNGERGERMSEVGPTLRSKTKAKTIDSTATSLDSKSSSDAKADETKVVVNNTGTHDELIKSTTIEQTRKENTLVNILDKPKSRRSSLNIEMKKTVGSHIDQMIENIKLNIAKSIESKIFGPEKSLVLSKNFEMSKTEEIVAPLSTELQKKNLEENDEDVNAPNVSKSEIKSENSENSVPKVADTAKEIEKMVMGDMEIADTQSQERQKNCSDNGNVATASGLVGVCKLENITNSENACEDFSGQKDLHSGNSGSHLVSTKSNEISGKSTEVPVEGVNEDQSYKGEDQAAGVDIMKMLTNTRTSDVNSENLSATTKQSVECSKSQSNEIQSLPEISMTVEKQGKRSSMLFEKPESADQISAQIKKNLSIDASSSQASNKDTPRHTLNYEIFKQELKEVHKNTESSILEIEPVTELRNANSALKSFGTGAQSLGISKNIETPVTGQDNTMESVCLSTTIQSEESETLESISREVERLVAESESENKKITSSSHRPSSETDKKKAEDHFTIKDSENCNKSSDNINDSVDSELETNRFLEVLESSFTDSDILTMIPEISEVLASKETSRTDAIPSQEILNSEESVNDAERCENDEVAVENQDTVCDHPSTSNGQDKILNSQNLSVALKLSHENREKSSNIPSQDISQFSRVKETVESQNLNVEQKSNSGEKTTISHDDLKRQKNLLKNPEIIEQFDRSIENDRSSTVSGETSSEKRTNSQEKTPHESNETSHVDTSNGEGTMKKDSRLDNIDKPITAEEQSCLIEENKRVLRARDRQKKVESTRKSQETVQNAKVFEQSKPMVSILELVKNAEDVDNAEIVKELGMHKNDSCQELTLNKQSNSDGVTAIGELDRSESDEPYPVENEAVQGSLIRTRRGRELKKRKDEQQQNQNVQKPKRSKRENKKSDQQNKEETLLDNEVAKINENTQSLTEKYEKSYKEGGNFRGFSEGSYKNIFSSGKVRKNDNDRSHSETDLEMVKLEMENVELIKKRSGNIPALPDVIEGNSSRNSEANSENDKKIVENTSKTPETLQKDLDESSTSSESSSSVAATPKILETPEDKVKKESILRLLGLESLEKAAERLSHQKAKKEQYTGTLKTVIRVQKEKDKKRSRSPLKMVLKQGRSDGDGDSPEFYTIQKELGTSGLGDSSSGANRKFSTNHRHSCDEDPEEPPSKDRQSLVIPEKSSSFSIHPGRLCADVCCYCFGKFGLLDTPMHLAQMKSDERRKKILNIDRYLTKDSCLCDACYRHVDRKANTSPTNMQAKPERQHRQLMVSKCSARECREPARHHVKRRWLLKIKAGLQNEVDIDWESSQHTSMSFCVNHYSKIERFLTCALCKRRLARNHTHQLVAAETDELNERLRHQGIPVPLSTGTFVCKLCRYFTQLQLKYKDIENMNANHKSFFKSYRKRILHYHDIEVLENEEEDLSSQGQPTKDKDKRKKSKCGQGKGGSSKSLDSTHNSASEKSTPEPNKNEGMNFETSNHAFGNQNSTNEKNRDQDSTACHDIQILNVEDSIENLKKRKSHDMQTYSNSPTVSSGDANDLVEILAMDKEVTLTRLPKRARTNSDITPVVQRLGANPSISVRTLFPGEEEMNLHANVEFNSVREVTPQGWEKCATMIQYDRDTKLLWQELQRPYGNQSSFLRHLILLEKYYRSGDLVLAPNASRNAINYSTSVQNRLISYEGPEKVDEPIMEPISSEFASPRRLSGGFVMERDRLSMPSTSSFLTNTSMNSNVANSFSNSTKTSPPRILKFNSGVSIIKKPPPNLHRLNLPSTSTSNANSSKRKDNRMPVMSGGKVFQLSEPEFKKLQQLKRQKQMLNEKQMSNINLTGNSGGAVSPSSLPSRPPTQYQKAQIAAQTQFQKHLRMQQEMLNRQSRSDFEPLICDVRSLTNENNPTQNLLSNLNLPKSIQVTTKPPNPIPIMPKIPKSLTVIPQTITRPTDK